MRKNESHHNGLNGVHYFTEPFGIVEVLCLPTWCMAGWPEGVVSLSRLGVGHVGECFMFVVCKINVLA